MDRGPEPLLVPMLVGTCGEIGPRSQCPLFWATLPTWPGEGWGYAEHAPGITWFAPRVNPWR